MFIIFLTQKLIYPYEQTVVINTQNTNMLLIIIDILFCSLLHCTLLSYGCYKNFHGISYMIDFMIRFQFLIEFFVCS